MKNAVDKVILSIVSVLTMIMTTSVSVSAASEEEAYQQMGSGAFWLILAIVIGVIYFKNKKK